MARNQPDKIFIGGVGDRQRQIRAALTAIIDDAGADVLPSEFDTFKTMIEAARDEFDARVSGETA